MKDRQPTKILANGAIRYGIYNEDGTLNHYEYMKREDSPTVEGTPLNKANLLSDETAAKIWPGSNKPEDPTVNDALNKLSQGTAKVGDIAITSRTDLSTAWLPCDGRTVTQEQYPELCDVLRTPASPTLWTESTAALVTNEGNHMISYANGLWFRSCSIQNSTTNLIEAKLYYSQDLNTWLEWPVQADPNASYAAGSYAIAIMHKMHYYNGQWVCTAWLYIKPSSGNAYQRLVVLFASTLGGVFNIDPVYEADTVYWGNRTHPLNSLTDVYYVNGYYMVPSAICVHYRSALNAISDITSDSTWSQTENLASYAYNAYYLCELAYDSSQSLFYIVYKNEYISSSTRYNTYISTVQDITSLTISTLSANSATLPSSVDTSSTSATPCIQHLVVDSQGAIFRATTASAEVAVRWPKATKTAVLFTNSSKSWSNMLFTGSVYVDAEAQQINIAETIDGEWDATISLQQQTAAFPATDSNQQVAVALVSAGAASQVSHNFAYDNKKIPNITTDTRSKAYIKALEE